MRSIVCVVCFFVVTNVLAEEVVLNDTSVMFLYESRAKLQLPLENAAPYLSMDYENTRDEFERRDILQKLEPIFKDKLNEARNEKQVVIRTNFTIDEYDFNKKGFPTGINNGSYYEFRNNYAATLLNGDKISMLMMDEKNARNLSKSLHKTREATMIITANISKVEEKKLNYYKFKTLDLVVTSVEIKHEDAGSIGKMYIK